MRTLRPRALAALLGALGAMLVAGCGGGGGGGGAAVPESADLIPASVPVFASVSADFESEQWKTAIALLERFPGAVEALEGVPRDGLGPELAVGVLELDSSSSEPPIMLVARPDDSQAFERELRESADVPVWRVLDGGWYVVADDQATLDQVIADAEAAPLSGSELFRASITALPEESLGMLYLDGEAVAETVTRQADGLGSTLAGTLDRLAGTPLETLAFGVSVEPGSVRLDGVVRTAGSLEVASFSPELTALVPADALVYAAFGDATAALQGLLDAGSGQQPDFEAQLAQVQLALGLSLEQDVLPLFAGEHALFIRAGLPLPELTLILSPADAPRALATLDTLVAGIPVLAQTAGDEQPFTVTETTIAGVPAKQLDFGEDGSLLYAAVADHIVLSTAAKGIADVAAPGASLADDEAFRSATEAAGVTGETTGLLYANVEGVVDLLGLLPDTDVDLEAIRPLRSVILAGSAPGEGELRLHGLLAIEQG